jgi:hypothetical protein
MSLTAVNLCVGMGFVLLLAFPVVGLLLLAARRFALNHNAWRVVAAAVAASIPYAHYAFSRADAIHLSLAIFPLLIGVIAAAGAIGGIRALGAGMVLLGASILTVSNAQPALSAHLLRTKWLQGDVAGEQLWMRPATFRHLQFWVASISDPTVGSHNFLAVPNMPSLHAIYRARMPIWEVYSLHSRSAEFEARELERLKSSATDLVLVSDHALDGRPELRYSQLRPRMLNWITANYRLFDVEGNPAKSHLMVYSREAQRPEEARR